MVQLESLAGLAQLSDHGRGRQGAHLRLIWIVNTARCGKLTRLVKVLVEDVPSRQLNSPNSLVLHDRHRPHLVDLFSIWALSLHYLGQLLRSFLRWQLVLVVRWDNNINL